MRNKTLETTKRIGTGLSFILYPIFAGIAFFAHPNLLSLEVGGPVADKVAEFHGNAFMHFGHFMMFLGVPLLIVTTIKFMRMLEGRSDWLGFIGGVMAVFGAIVLAADKTALCLVMSAFESVPEAQYAGLLPGIEALFGFKGYIAILYFLPLLPVGVLIQAVGLYRTNVIPRWSSVLIIISMLGMGVSAAVDIDLFGLIATIVLAVSYIPLGIQFIRGDLQ
ncbi:MAG: hypothetical protein PVI78_05725 [Anaerolineales bacterium]|jgi:hypothetical protein